MKRSVFTDPYFYNQPDLAFIEELRKPLHMEKPDYYGKKEILPDEVDASGLYIANKFEDDAKGVLESI